MVERICVRDLILYEMACGGEGGSLWGWEGWEGMVGDYVVLYLMGLLHNKRRECILWCQAVGLLEVSEYVLSCPSSLASSSGAHRLSLRLCLLFRTNLEFNLRAIKNAYPSPDVINSLEQNRLT